MAKPDYFESIQTSASSRWSQLENDPELAGPWHQLFKQVQSPRHVLSELLQNADDANATEATVEIDNTGVFVFSHNGDDFIDEHFRSLCRFGYSNKRELHTIGFRGVGFKSVFSLGDGVELLTPTLSVKFFRRRFTEPQWHESNNERVNTQIRVRIEDKHRLKEIEKNLDEWKKSPVSLLFFKKIRRLKITDTEISWSSDGVGPVSNSEWMLLNGKENKFLLVRSAEEIFPPDALSEIAQERLLPDQSKIDFPPSRVELVLGAKGRLFVVLPTGVETQLPFAINAPFVQDPARLKIKDPETSPTNRWLLKRVGDLAGETLLAWLQSETLTVQEKVEAYQIFPDVDRDNESLEGTCGTEVELAFEEVISNEKILLTEEGSLTEKNRAVVVPRALTEVWPSQRCTDFFDTQKRPPLCHYVSAAARKKLSNWNLLDSISQDVVTTVLVRDHLPKPETWEKLLKLWSYMSPKIDRRDWITNPQVRIFPVSGSEVLYSAEEVVRLKGKKGLKSDEDWQFLSGYLSVLDQGWLRFIENSRNQKSDEAAKAYDILNAFSLSEGNDDEEIIEQVTSAFFGQDGIKLADCIRLAHIAAALDVAVGESFRYVSNDLNIRDTVLIDPNGVLGTVIDPAWLEENLLHSDYQKSFTSCTEVEWNAWVRSGKSQLLQMLPLKRSEQRVYGREQIQSEIQKRGAGRFSGFPYVTNDFVIQDWDFEDRHWRHWNNLAKSQQDLWRRLTDQLFIESKRLVEGHSSCSILQIATTGSRQRLYLSPDPLPSWILKLRKLPCLQDTHGSSRRPDELLRRTTATEPLLDVELFVDKRFDVERYTPLLDLLGVGTFPTGPAKILASLRSLATSTSPPVSEVEKWYGRLDVLFDHCSTEDADEIRNAFAKERLILTENGIWETSAGVFLNADEHDAPGAEIIRSSVRNLMLWTKVGVAERPSLELAIKWLRTLPSGKPLTKEEVKRIQNLLAAHPIRVWEECEHWMNLNAEWVSVDDLSYYVSMQSLVKYSHLFPNIKQRTADFQKLNAETVNAPPFNRLVRLAEVIEKQFYKTNFQSGQSQAKPWLTQLGLDIARIKLEDEDEPVRIRELGKRLAETKWKIEKKIQVMPYIEGVPAGEAFEEDVAWISDVIYVKDQPTGKIARAVSNELCKAFRIAELEDAIKLCLERDVEFVSEYMDENFELDSLADIVDEPTQDRKSLSEGSRDKHSAEMEEGDARSTDADADHDASEEPQTLDESEDDFDNGADDEFDSDDFDEDDRNEFYDDEDEDEETPERTRSKRPQRRSLIDRFAEQNGFKKDSDDRYFHGNGSWIAKNKDSIGFQWEQRRGNGSIVKFYHVRDHCLEKRPLEVDTDVFGLLRNHPDLYSLVIVDSEDAPIELTGERIDEMRRDRMLSLLPATYRIVRIG
ncbi:MAG: sacsin N-terminal ATP-binding-like domain-containing protein [Pyrinomonadaceae bacterium]